jgi:hypothetical protein
VVNADYWLHDFCVRIVLVLAAVVLSSYVWSGEYDARAMNLISDDPGTRNSALMELSVAANRADARGEFFDFSRKEEIFSKLSEIEDFDYVSNVARLLSRLPIDAVVLERAKSILSQPAGPGSKTSLVAALQYTRQHALDTFRAYFETLTYDEIDEELAQALIGDEIVHAKRVAYYRALVASFLTWTPPANSFDFENPFRVKLLEAHRETLGEIFREMYAEPFRAIPLELIWLWGEMGAIEGVPLLDLLLQEYAERPSPRTAISIGSALGTLNVTMLVDYGFTDEEVRAIWKEVLGSRWPAVQDKAIDEITAYWRNNWVEVREDCKRRSVPELG